MRATARMPLNVTGHGRIAKKMTKLQSIAIKNEDGKFVVLVFCFRSRYA